MPTRTGHVERWNTSQRLGRYGVGNFKALRRKAVIRVKKIFRRKDTPSDLPLEDGMHAAGQNHVPYVALSPETGR